VTFRIDQEAEATEMILARRNEEVALLRAGTSPAARRRYDFSESRLE
jgi:hypothetical protein